MNLDQNPRLPGATRLLALLACHDEMRFLPGYFANISSQVDGVIALDDGSRTGRLNSSPRNHLRSN